LKSITLALALFSSVAVAVPADCSDSIYKLKISDALDTVDAKTKLDGSVQFYFGASPHPAVLRDLGTYDTNQKTNGFGKSDEHSCQWVFLSALLKLQERAKSVGANAVIDIHSYFRKEDVSSETEIDCHVGFLISGIALKGRFAKVARARNQ